MPHPPRSNIQSQSGHPCISAVVTEWLRRLIRNQLGSARTCSNTVPCEVAFLFYQMSFAAFCFHSRVKVLEGM